MAAPTVDFIKTWCRVDGAEFDDILPVMIASATASASQETGHDYATEAMPESVQMWCAAQVSHWLSMPDAAVSPSGNNQQKNIFLDGLLDPHRLYVMETRP